MPRLLLFDIDMTLIRGNGAGRGSIDAAFADLFGIERATKDITIDGRTDKGILMEAIERHGVAARDAEVTYRRVLDCYLEHLRRMLPLMGGYVLPGVPGLLDELDARGLPLGLATGNVRRGAETKLSHFGLWTRFAEGGFGDDTAIRSEIVATAIERLAAVCDIDPDPGDALVIGDTPLDVQAAQQAGTRALGVATGRYSAAELRTAGADFVLDDLSDTPAVLEILLS